jgi:hypothetical protein
MKSEGFTISIGKSTIIGIEPGSTFTISSSGADRKEYSAPIEKVHQTLARWHAKENPTGKKRRKLFKSSEEMRASLKRG